jgi:hypothetical protein
MVPNAADDRLTVQIDAETEAFEANIDEAKASLRSLQAQLDSLGQQLCPICSGDRSLPGDGMTARIPDDTVQQVADLVSEDVAASHDIAPGRVRVHALRSSGEADVTILPAEDDDQ